MENDECAHCGVGSHTICAYINCAAVIFQNAFSVVIPEDVRGLLQRLGDHAFQADGAAGLHVDVGLAGDFNLRD